MQTRPFQSFFCAVAVVASLVAVFVSDAAAEDRAMCQNTAYRPSTAAQGWFVPCNSNGDEVALAYVEPYAPHQDAVSVRMTVDFCDDGEYLECSFSTTGFDNVTQTEDYKRYPYDHDIQQLSIYCWCKEN